MTASSSSAVGNVTPVAYLSLRVVKTCPVCEKPARWQVGSRHVSCDDHLADVITTAYYENNPQVTP